MKNKKLIKRAFSVFLAVAVSFACIPAFAGSLEADAASPYWKNVHVKSCLCTSNTITWKKLTKKQRKKISGIAVFQGTDQGSLKCIKRVRKTRTSCEDKNVRPGTKYCYQLRTYKIKKVKQKQYYNKKTGKWQTKKLRNAKKRTVKVTRYKYAHRSPLKWVTTKQAKNTPAAGTGLPKVTGLRAAVVTSNSIAITWNKVTGKATAYQVFLNGSQYCLIGAGANVLHFERLSCDTTYQIKVRVYLNDTRSESYGPFTAITVKTNKKNTPPSYYGERIYPTDLDYQNIPVNPGSVQIGDGTFVTRSINPRLLPVVEAWMAENLPADATDAEKVNLCEKAFNELIYTPESIAAVGDPADWEGNSECIRTAIYFDTCCKAAGIISATRNCTYDDDYGVPFLRTHYNNFVWVDGKGYVTDVHVGTRSSPVLCLIDYDWQNWHIVPTNTKFDCRYY